MTTVYVLNGPNLNLRDAAGHGTVDLAGIERTLRERAGEAAIDVIFLQTNHEGDLIDWIQEAGAAGAPVILNAGAYSHTSIALQDAIRGTGAVVFEVHPSNIHANDSVRRRSTISPVARGVIMGLGPQVYELALDAVLRTASQRSEQR